MRVCVIGAGVSGLVSGKALRDKGIDYTCFEASDDVGGNWYFRNPNGRSSAYRSLHIDTSKHAISFADFPMEERYPDFPHHTEIKQFLREYAESLSFDLSFQDFESEVADPLGFYELVLLTQDGCVALRRIDELTCEMKRLFVRPAARGSGLGRQLAEAMIVEARARGYRRMLLDTVPEMAAAQALYRSLGFRETQPYRHNPVPGAVFLELAL